jgi:hypothetical protein
MPGSNMTGTSIILWCFMAFLSPSREMKCILKLDHDRFLPGGTILQAGGSRFRFPMRSLHFSTDPLLPAALRPWGRLSLLTEMSTRNLSEGKGWPAGRRVRLATHTQRHRSYDVRTIHVAIK